MMDEQQVLYDERYQRGLWMLENQFDYAFQMIAFWNVVGYSGKFGCQLERIDIS